MQHYWVSRADWASKSCFAFSVTAAESASWAVCGGSNIAQSVATQHEALQVLNG